MLMKRDEGGKIRPSREELEGGSFDDLATGLADGTITRGRAIKLAGAALVGGALTLFWPEEADARRRRKRRGSKRRRNRRRTRARKQRFINNCESNGGVVCQTGTTLACCPPADPGVDACANVLNNPLCVRLDLSSL